MAKPSTQILETNPSPTIIGFLVGRENSGAQIIELGNLLTIGRHHNNDLELLDPYVSNHHAQIERNDRGYLLKDLDSQNGTLLNGSRIVEVYLADGDRIKFGEREFTFQNASVNKKGSWILQSKSEDWNKQLQSLPIFAHTDLPVLFLGASGTGKEVLARAVHDHSRRRSGPFISVNCSALSDGLIESELFGHIKGSYTGAHYDRKGAFEAARGGSLFLDEVGDLPLSLQPKLLRALENHEIRPVGLDRNIQTDVRIIAATHKNLQVLIAKGLFRADLFYRLHVIKMMLPPLKDRMEDFETLLYGFAREMRVRFSHDAIMSMKTHNWPGNIRELKNFVARASALYPKEYIQREHVAKLLEMRVVGAQSSIIPPNKPILKELEKEMILNRLIQNRGNQRKTAQDLGMPKSTLYDRIKSYKIDIEQLLKDNPDESEPDNP